MDNRKLKHTINHQKVKVTRAILYTLPHSSRFLDMCFALLYHSTM